MTLNYPSFWVSITASFNQIEWNLSPENPIQLKCDTHQVLIRAPFSINKPQADLPPPGPFKPHHILSVSRLSQGE
jgi:hypothetical protein